MMAILVVNVWTKYKYLMPGIFTNDQAIKEKERLENNCSKTGNIRNNDYKIVELV